jgi:hypothetical protein
VRLRERAIFAVKRSEVGEDKFFRCGWRNHFLKEAACRRGTH